MATEADFKRIGNYALLYNKDQKIDRRKATRTVPMEVLSLGYSRTGTLSMRKAFEILSYPNPYHFSSMYDNVSEADLWMEAMSYKFFGKGDTIPNKEFFDGILGHVSATTDVLCMLFAKELTEAYPDAKVVLVERDVESWYQSWMSFCKDAYNPVINYVGRLDPIWLGKLTRVGGTLTRIETSYARDLDEVAVRAKDAYRHHYRDVRELVPQERLSNFNLKDGWGPLCEFLGEPVPNVPFPHENEAERNQQAFKEVLQKGLKNMAASAATLMTIIAVPVAGFS